MLRLLIGATIAATPVLAIAAPRTTAAEVPLAADPDAAAVPEPEAPVVVVPLPPSDTLPEPVRKLIATAIAQGDEAAVATIVAIARKAYPSNVSAIKVATAQHDAEIVAKREAAEKARIARLANPDPLANWKGEVEFGASRATGNTYNLALYAAVKADREGLKWSHSLTFRADLQTTAGATTTERIQGAYQPRYNVEDGFYAYGLGQFEHDRLLGISSRETVGSGIGYGVIRRKDLKLDFEGGPALRHSEFGGDGASTNLAARASVKLRWTISPNLLISQDGALFIEHSNDNASATTTLETKLLGALKARFSYNLQYESVAPNRQTPLDTVSRATLVYGF